MLLSLANEIVSFPKFPQKILSVDDPASIYYMQPQWTTVLRKDIDGFVFNPIYQGTYDFYSLRRKS